MKGEKLIVDWYNGDILTESGSELMIEEMESNLLVDSDSSIVPKMTNLKIFHQQFSHLNQKLTIIHPIFNKTFKISLMEQITI